MKTRWIKWALLGLGIGLAVWGWLGGEAAVMRLKAIHICLECMGLGA